MILVRRPRYSMVLIPAEDQLGVRLSDRQRSHGQSIDRNTRWIDWTGIMHERVYELLMMRKFRVPELDQLPPEDRQPVLEQAVATVNATYGRLERLPHYVGCALIAAIILPLAILEKGLVAVLVGGLVGMAVYFACFFLGILMIRRSMERKLRRLLRDAVTTRLRPR